MKLRKGEKVTAVGLKRGGLAEREDCVKLSMGMKTSHLPIVHKGLETQKPLQACTLDSDTSQKCLNHSLHGLEGGGGDRSHIGDGKQNAIPGSQLSGCAFVIPTALIILPLITFNC